MAIQKITIINDSKTVSIVTVIVIIPLGEFSVILYHETQRFESKPQRVSEMRKVIIVLLNREMIQIISRGNCSKFVHGEFACNRLLTNCRSEISLIEID